MMIFNLSALDYRGILFISNIWPKHSLSTEKRW